MKELEHAFNLRVESHPQLSSFVCFCRAVQDISPNNRTLMAGFKKLVDTSDYSKSDMNDIREWLKSLVKRK
jgi:hypothetical protein